MTTSLKALAESKTDGIQKATYFKLHPSLVHFEPGFNLREEGPELDAHIKRLADAMRAGAYIPPIDVAVVDGEVIARDGHCRTRAAQALVAEGVDYLLEARQVRGNEADAVFHMLGSDTRKSFSPLELGRGYARLVAYGQSVATIADKLGLSRTTIENGLAMAQMPVAVQAQVTAGKVAPHLALKTVKQHGTKAAEKLQEAVDTAAKAGKAKATAKHVEDAGSELQVERQRTKALRDMLDEHAARIRELEATAKPAPSPESSGDPYARLYVLAKQLAAVNVVVSALDRNEITKLVHLARELMGQKS